MAKKVLIIDDDESLRDVFGMAMQMAGFEYQTAEDGVKGIEAYKSYQPDLILLDLMMPRMNGAQVLDKLTELKSTTPVVVATGYGEMVGDPIRQHPCVREVVKKPVKAGDLQALAKKILA